MAGLKIYFRRESFFGGAVSTREASAARRWDTLFDEPPPEPSVAVSRAAAGGKVQRLLVLDTLHVPGCKL